MSRIPFINAFMLAGIVASSIFLFSFSDEIKEEKPLPPLPKKTELPVTAFKASSSAYEQIGSGPLNLVWKAPTLELPDLKEEILYFGKNARPDVEEGRSLFFITLKTSNLSKMVEAGEKVYLVYSKGVFSFSQENRPTALWVEMQPAQEHASSDCLDIKVTLNDEEAGLITTPKAHHSFTAKLAENKNANALWELPGGIRVDGSLFARLRARFVGPDTFLAMHGGDEFAFAADADRIDFIENESLYSCFVKEGSFLIWKEGQWQSPEDGCDTTQYPLLVLKKSDEKTLTFDLWEAQGKGKLQLSLVKIKIHEGMPEITHEFKFVGAKTWSQFIVECRGQRETLRPGDWLLLTRDGWKKLETPEMVDDYVFQKEIGPLFVLDKMIKKEGHRLLLGHLFNTSRTEVREIELGTPEPKGNVES